MNCRPQALPFAESPEQRPSKIMKTSSEIIDTQHRHTQPCMKAESTALSVTNAVQLQRGLGKYPPGSLTSIYQNQTSRKSFIYDARRGLVAARDLHFQDQLGYLEGYAYTFCPGMNKGIVKLGHGVYLDQTGAQGNMLQHIGSTMNRRLVNVHCDDNGLVVCTKPITASDTLLLLGVAPVPEQLPTESKHWLISNMVQAFKDNQYFLLPHALIDASITSMSLSVAFGGSMTFMPLTLVLTYDLLVQYKNLSWTMSRPYRLLVNRY